MMKTLMIHNLRQAYFQLDLKQYVLSFDDGLFCQYYYLPLLQTYQTPLIFFITTAFIQPGQARSMYAGEFIETVKPKKYMQAAFADKDFSQFMTVAEVRRLATTPGVRIGAHSHFHDVIIDNSPPKKSTTRWKIERSGFDPGKMGSQYSIRSRLAFQGWDFSEGQLQRRSRQQWLDYIAYDTELCLKWFDTNLGFLPDSYCLPFNEYNEQLIAKLEEFGFKEFYGRSRKNPRIAPRIDIDALVSD